MELCQNALLPELNTLNLFDKIKSIQVPVHFIQGKLDGIAPYRTAAAFCDYLQAGTKSFSVFENSAHMPHYEEPMKFVKVLNKKKLQRNMFSNESIEPVSNRAPVKIHAIPAGSVRVKTKFIESKNKGAFAKLDFIFDKKFTR